MPRDYAKVSPQFWTGCTGRKIRAKGKDAILTACYLMTCPSANAIGLYYLPVPTLCHETGLSAAEADRALAHLAQVDFAFYDHESEHVWVMEMCRHQIGDTITSERDNSRTHIDKELRRLRRVPFSRDFYLKYRSTHCLANVELDALFRFDEGTPFRPPSDPLRNQETEQEQEQEIEQEREKAAPAAPPALRLECSQEPPQKPAPRASKRAAPRWTRVPDGELLTDVRRRAATDLSLDPEWEWAKYLDEDFKPPGHVDVDRTWRNWCKRAVEYRGRTAHHAAPRAAHQPAGLAKTSERLRSLEQTPRGTGPKP